MARDADVFGVTVTPIAQRTFVFGLLVAILMAGAVWSRRRANDLEAFLARDIKWSRRGGANIKPENLLQALNNRFFNWLNETRGPIIALNHVVIFGFLLPVAGFFVMAFLWTWLFPGKALHPAAAVDGCTRSPQLLAFIWEHSWRGAALNLPDVLGWKAPSALQTDGDVPAIAYVASLRLYLAWAGSISLAQTTYLLLRRQLTSLIVVMWIPLRRVLVKLFRPSERSGPAENAAGN